MPANIDASKEESPLETALRAAIDSSGLSHRQIAIAAGIAQSQVSRFIARQVTLTLPAVGALCEALGIRCKQTASSRRNNSHPS